MSPTKPRVFIGSSAESLPELRIIQKVLSSFAVVVPWTDESLKRIGGFFLQSLLEHAPTFDFAIFVFGGHDIITSRGVIQPAARDNVIFEAGLFMAHLGAERTPVIAPRNINLKVLTDFAGLVLADYEAPNFKSPNYKSELARAMRGACEKIVKRIKELGPRRTEIAARPGPLGVASAGEIVKNLLEESLKKGWTARVRNIALDMEITWPILKEHLLDDQRVRNVIWQSLMIDPGSEKIQRVSSETVSVQAALDNQMQIRKEGVRLKEKLKQRKVSFECRVYASLPLIHGFLIDPQGVLLLTLCDIEKGKLLGRRNAYLRLDKVVDN